MIKILFVLSNTNLGGAEKQAIHLACGLRELYDYDVRFICNGTEEGTATRLLRELAIDFEFFSIYNGNSKTKTIQGLYRLICTIRNYKPYILMPYVSLADYYSSLIWRFTNAKLLIWNQRDEGLGLHDGMIPRLIINNASHYISNSIISITILNEKYGVNLKKITLIYNGINLRKAALSRTAWRAKYGFAEEDILIGMIANITKHKDHVTLINAWALILENNTDRKNFKLILAGRKDEKYDEVNTLVSKLPDPSSVVYMDFLDDIASMVNAIDLSVLTSVSEGFSNSVLESMSGSLVVLGTNIFGISEPLSDENRRYLSEPGNEVQLYQSIREMIYNTELRKKIGELNKARIISNFQMTHTVERTHELINKLKTCKNA